MLNFVLDVDNMFIYINELIIKLLLNLYAKFHVCEYIVFLSEIDELWVVVVELCKNSCWLVIVIDFKHVVELMLWVLRLMNWWRDFVLLLKVEKVIIIWWIMCIWCYNLKFDVCLSALYHIWPINIFGIKFGTLKWSKWGFLGENGLKPERTISGNMLARLSERTSSVSSEFWTQHA